VELEPEELADKHLRKKLTSRKVSSGASHHYLLVFAFVKSIVVINLFVH
jgi:hypothetical protein